MMPVEPKALAHADDLKMSFDQLQSDIAFIRNCADGTYERAARLAVAYARAELRHLTRCLVSARSHGASADFWLAMLNRWTADGDYGRLGNHANERRLGIQ
jgi:hypothetical protein